MSLFRPPFLFRCRTSKERSLIILALWVTTAPRGDTLRLWICLAKRLTCDQALIASNIFAEILPYGWEMFEGTAVVTVLQGVV